MEFKVELNEIRKDRLCYYIEKNEDDLPIDQDLEDPPNFDDAPRILLDLRSNKETDVLKSYAMLIQLCQFNYIFPNEYFPDVLEHTLSKNETIAESSQGFLIFLFRKHPIEAQYFCQIDVLDYFNQLIPLPFNRETVAYLMTIFKKKLLDTDIFLNSFFDIFFEHIDHDIQSPDFFHRLDFLQIFIYVLSDFSKCVCERCTKLVLNYFPQLLNFDRDLLCIFLSITSKCMNVEIDEEWLKVFISNNYVLVLLDLFSDDDHDINLYIAWCLCGISGSSHEISQYLLSLHIFEFLGNRFIICNDHLVQSLFIRIVSNLLIGHELEYDIFTKSQLFQDILTIFDGSPLKLKKEIIRLICYLVLRLKEQFIQQFVELKLVRFFIDALYLENSLKTKRYVLIALATIIKIYDLLIEKSNQNTQNQLYNNTYGMLIESILADNDLVEAIDDYIVENNQPVPTKELVTALDIQRALYNFNSFDS